VLALPLILERAVKLSHPYGNRRSIKQESLFTLFNAGGSAMNYSALGALLVIVACGGCRMCSDCCDYLPPVANSQYATQGQRAGSAFGSANTVGVIRARGVPDSTDSAFMKRLPAVEPET